MSRVIGTSMSLTLICTFRSSSLEVPIPAQPPERLLYDPPLWQDLEALGLLVTLWPSPARWRE